MAGHFFTTIEDNVTGRPVVGATLEVYTASATVVGDEVTSGTYATIYSDDGITSIDQTFSVNRPTSDSRGFVEFWTNENSVVLEVSYGGSAKKAITDVEITGGNVNSDVTALAIRVDNHDTLLGLPANSTDLGTFTGTTISDNTSILVALQELETSLETKGSGTGDLVSTNNLSDVANASTSRSNLGAASTSQTDGIAGFIEAPADGDYKLVVKAPFAGTITETTTISTGGTCTATFKINTTALGGTANSVSSSEQSQAHASANSFAAGDDIVLTISANSSCADMSYTIKFTRTLA